MSVYSTCNYVARTMTEAQVQESVANYISIRYGKDVIFHSDFGSGVKLSFTQAKRQRRQNGGRRGFPDLQICEPIDVWHGFFLEIKKEGIRIVKRNNELVADQHIREQASMIEQLRAKGYWADFGIGYDDCIRKIDAYMEGKADAKKWTSWSS